MPPLRPLPHRRLRAETLPELIRTNSYAALDEALRAHIRKRNVLDEIPIIDSLFIDDALNSDRVD
jgi:hypothetical protein